MVRRKLTGLSGKDIVRALKHGALDLPPGTVRSIIEKPGLTDEEFNSLL